MPGRDRLLTEICKAFACVPFADAFCADARPCTPYASRRSLGSISDLYDLRYQPRFYTATDHLDD